MALTIPSYPDPRDPDHPLTNAYAWIAALQLDLRGGGGAVVLSIHPRESAWRGQPAGVLRVGLGEHLTPGGRFPTLDELMADPEFAGAYAVIGRKLYEQSTKHPLFRDATVVL